MHFCSGSAKAKYCGSGSGPTTLLTWSGWQDCHRLYWIGKSSPRRWPDTLVNSMLLACPFTWTKKICKELVNNECSLARYRHGTEYLERKLGPTGRYFYAYFLDWWTPCCFPLYSPVPQKAVLRIRIRDPVPNWPLDPGSGMGKKSWSGSGIYSPDHISESLETVFWVKILKFFEADPGSGMEKIQILHPG